MTTIELQDARLAAYLALIGFSEGTSTSKLTRCHGYDVIVSGPDGGEVFTDFSHHPFAHRPPKIVNAARGLKSTASGRYQVLLRYWETYSQMLGLVDFSATAQDAVATQQIREVGALPMIYAGDIERAITRCGGIWASLPGNHYAQNPHTVGLLMAHWDTIKPLEAA